MHDVAREAGVSLKTVSRVVNEESGVSQDLTCRVEAAIATLGYRPNEPARRLRQAGTDTGTIGFVLIGHANPFFSALQRGIEEVVRARDCLVLTGNALPGDGEYRLIESLVDRRVDGFIVVSASRDCRPLRAEIDHGTPVVLLDLEMATDVPVDIVRSDHYGGAEIATGHLISNGHTEIAYMGDDSLLFSGGLRFDGFRDTMVSAGLTTPVDRSVVGSHTPDEWRGIATEMFGRDPHPTAIFTAQNFVTMGVVRALHDLDLQHSVAVVGFDDVDFADALDPGITVVPQQPEELGRRAAEVLFSRVDGGDHPRIVDIFGHSLVARGSGEIPPL
jgi:LacI family transcriptional regulator